MNPTKIEYVDVSWSPIAMRCTPVSPGCANCWHLEMCGRFAKNPKIPAHLRAVYAGNAPPMLIESRLQQPLEDKTPWTIATQFMGDLFHDDITVAMLRKIFAVMREAAWHTFYVLTKRPIGMLAVSEHLGYWPENAWAGVTVENQKAADERIPVLMKVPAAIRWVSLEPMLGAVDLKPYLPDIHCAICGERECLHGEQAAAREFGGLNWVVVGGESGPGARPMESDWVRSIRDQCVAAGVPFYFKQWGSLMSHRNPDMPEDAFAEIDARVNLAGYGGPEWFHVGKRSGRELDGRVWDQKPEVPQCPR